jgi:hypothetical protein
VKVRATLNRPGKTDIPAASGRKLQLSEISLVDVAERFDAPIGRDDDILWMYWKRLFRPAFGKGEHHSTSLVGGENLDLRMWTEDERAPASEIHGEVTLVRSETISAEEDEPIPGKTNRSGDGPIE